jgi:pimeloyl-ACP methyl ester carboxylesterase
MATTAEERTRRIPSVDTEQIERANATDRTPVVFLHGLWRLPSNWDRWAELFENAAYSPLTPGWPDDPETVEEANGHPEVANKTIGQVADHYYDVLSMLNRKPAVIGHYFGGVLAQMVAGRGCSAATVAISPTPFRGVLPLPISALNPWTEVKVDADNGDRGPVMIIAGEKDPTAPPAVALASYKKQAHNDDLTEMVEIPNRGCGLAVDSWREVAETALEFVQRNVSAVREPAGASR